MSLRKKKGVMITIDVSEIEAEAERKPDPLVDTLKFLRDNREKAFEKYYLMKKFGFKRYDFDIYPGVSPYFRDGREYLYYDEIPKHTPCKFCGDKPKGTSLDLRIVHLLEHIYEELKKE